MDGTLTRPPWGINSAIGVPTVHAMNIAKNSDSRIRWAGLLVCHDDFRGRLALNEHQLFSS